MNCPRCHADVTGRFCGFCGAALEERRCPDCRGAVAPGHAFCSECGAAQPGSPPPPASPAGSGGIGGGPPGSPIPRPQTSSRAAWWVGGASLILAAGVLALPYLWSQGPGGARGDRLPMPGVMGGAAAVDLSTMTPREAADRLFNRVMAALSAGDRTEVATFLPMALDAYALVPDLDADGHFHLSLLQQAAGDHAAGLETAERVLATQPDHLLALYAAGEAARGLGRMNEARAHFRHLLEVFDREMARRLPEYEEHAGFMPTVLETARSVAGG